MCAFIFFGRRSYYLVHKSKKLIPVCVYSSRLSFITFTPQVDSLQKSPFFSSFRFINFSTASNLSYFCSSLTVRPLSTSCSHDFEHEEKKEARSQNEKKIPYESDKGSTDEDVIDIDEWDLKYSDEYEEEGNTNVWETLESNIEWVDASEGVYDWEADTGDVAAQMGDGGDGGGVVLNNVLWGPRVLSTARELLNQFDGKIEMFSFKASHQGYVYVRLDKLSDKYGRPSGEEIDLYSNQLKTRLDEEVDKGNIADYLAIEVSGPGALRILKVPHDIERFKRLAMTVSYVEDGDDDSKEKVGFFMLDSIEKESETCVWRLANVVENREANKIKGRPLSKEQRQWRLALPYKSCKRVLLYI